ncbi:hypothetical protein IMCC26134_09635 [Verrucomicrobia bacterium IMCC26134]|nr:hypothetical protein IMCC26134_09635 [Verrucomicrobia bacterium IMCC26134]
MPFVFRVLFLGLIAFTLNAGAAPAKTPVPVIPADAPAWEGPMRANLEKMAADLTATLTPWVHPRLVILPEIYGAKADGNTLNTTAIQNAIDICAYRGGGTVLLSAGDYLTGALELKSGVIIEIAKGCRLLGSTNLVDYTVRTPKRPTVMSVNYKVSLALLYAEGVEKVGIRGPGTIDFQGGRKYFTTKPGAAFSDERPFGIHIIDSKKILVENISLKDSSSWMQSYLNCEDLIIRRMKVENHANDTNAGLTIDGCRRVIVRDTYLNSASDAFSLKGASFRPTEDVLVDNCTFYSAGAAFKIGDDTQGDFRRIYAKNLKLGGVPLDLRSSAGHEAGSGITLATIDGGTVEDVLIRSAVIERSRAPIFLRVGNRGRVMPGMPRPPAGTLKHVVIEDISGLSNFRQGSLIAGVKEGLVQDLVVRRVKLGMEGGGSADMTGTAVDENENGAADAGQFSPQGLPAYGFYLRHAAGISFSGISITPTAPDARPLFFDGGNTDDISVDGAPMLPASVTSPK